MDKLLLYHLVYYIPVRLHPSAMLDTSISLLPKFHLVDLTPMSVYHFTGVSHLHMDTLFNLVHDTPMMVHL